MHVTLIVRMTASNQNELIKSFGAGVELYRDYITEQHKKGTFGPPEDVTIHYLITGGKWHNENTPEWGKEEHDLPTGDENPTADQVPDVP